MKQCPVCKNTYTDDSLAFCLSDGTRLVDSEPGNTLQFPQMAKPTEEYGGRVNIPVNAPSMETRISPPVVTTTQNERKGCSPLMVGVIVGLLGIFAAAGIGITYFSLKDKPVIQNSTPTPTVSQTPILNTNEQQLKEKLDKLEKQLEEQKKNANKKPIPSPSAAPSIPNTATSAQVNSPGDGFLALRNEPSSKTGYQILRMPHGASVSVYGCQGYTMIGNKRGRWCQVSYDGYNGWAFDAFLVY